MKKYEDDAFHQSAARKEFEWMSVSKPAVAARGEVQDCHRTGGGEEQPAGVALPPHERNCGRSHPMQGTNSDDLTEWCIKHET